MKVIRAARCGLTAMACAVVLQACAGNGKGLDADGNPIGTDSSTSVPLSADFASLQANIFTPICSVCHSGGGAPEGLRLDAADSYNLLVGVPSTEVPSLLRVKPGDPDNSYIIQKLEGIAAVGGQMPLNGPYLPTTTIAFIRQWITNGAQPAVSAAVTPAPFALEAILPEADASVAEPPAQIMLSFNRELDLSQLGALTARIEELGDTRSDARDAAGEARTTRAHISAPSGNLRALMIVPEQTLAPGRYRVLVHANPLPNVSDLSGRSIILGSPTLAGDAIVSTFNVESAP